MFPYKPLLLILTKESYVTFFFSLKLQTSVSKPDKTLQKQKDTRFQSNKHITCAIHCDAISTSQEIVYCVTSLEILSLSNHKTFFKSSQREISLTLKTKVSDKLIFSWCPSQTKRN